MRYWQEKKSKIENKNQVIEDYLQSFKRSSTLLDGFVKRTFDALSHLNKTLRLILS